MENSGLSASDVLALTRNNEDMFGGVGGFILLFIFLMAISGNGFGFGGNAGGLALADIQNSLYNQSQDNNARSLAQGQCNLTDTVLTSSYNNLLATKDIQNQISNSVAGLGNLITEQNQATRDMIMQNKIDMLNDQIVVLRGQNSNLEQTANLTGAINAQTNTILNSLGKWRAYPPCCDTCGCNGLV